MADTKARIEAGVPGINTAILKRQVVRLESGDLAAAKKRVVEEFDAVPSRPGA